MGGASTRQVVCMYIVQYSVAAVLSVTHVHRACLTASDDSCSVAASASSCIKETAASLTRERSLGSGRRRPSKRARSFFGSGGSGTDKPYKRALRSSSLEIGPGAARVLAPTASNCEADPNGGNARNPGGKPSPGGEWRGGERDSRALSQSMLYAQNPR